jgi:sulfatase modifying factor 1
MVLFMRTCTPVLFLAAFAALVSDARAVVIQWSPVRNAGNSNDPLTGVGAINYTYNIGKYDVTNSQYAEFLNAKDPMGVNALDLYSNGMSNAVLGGINFSNSNADGAKYTLIAGDENHPVTYVTWYDTLRFANWMNNGQGTGNTETGAYTLFGGTPTPSNGQSVLRNTGASVFLPALGEWYKAAYFNPSTHTYFKYATASNTAPTATAPPGTSNAANYLNAVGHTIDVGAYVSSPSSYGTFDQAGNAFQWTESAFDSRTKYARGGTFNGTADSGFVSSTQSNIYDPATQKLDVGFRLASIPEPSTLVLAAFGFIGLAAWGWRRRMGKRTA